MLFTFCNIVLLPLFPPIYLYSCSSHPLYIGMLFPHSFIVVCLLILPGIDLMLFYYYYYYL